MKESLQNKKSDLEKHGTVCFYKIASCFLFQIKRVGIEEGVSPQIGVGGNEA